MNFLTFNKTLSSNIYLTSDWHFNHNKDFIWKARGFSSVEEMNQTIIKKYNRIVGKNDIVFFLGDAIMGQDAEAGIKLISKMNGIKYLAFGNHDTNNRLKMFEDNHLFKDIQMGYRIKYNNHIYILTHYPTNVSNGEDTQVTNFFGHTHQKGKFFIDAKGNEIPYMYNIGVDAHNCEPVNIKEAIKDISEKKSLI